MGKMYFQLKCFFFSFFSKIVGDESIALPGTNAVYTYLAIISILFFIFPFKNSYT